MSVTDELLAKNKAYAASYDTPPQLPSSSPVAVIACMDAGPEVYRMLGLKEGQVHVISNAGGVVTDDVLRSLAMSQRQLGSREVMLVHHSNCGMLPFADQGFRGSRENETDLQAGGGRRNTGDLDEDVRDSLARIKADAHLLHKDQVRGFIFDVATGRLNEVLES